MTPELTESDQAKFAELKNRLEGVERAEPDRDREPPGFGPLDPMLATPFPDEKSLGDLPESDWFAERKFDGTRLLLEKFDGEVELYTRRAVERSDTVQAAAQEAIDRFPDGVILDCEYTFIDPSGTSQFIPIHATSRIEARDVTGYLYIFDILAEDGEWCLDDPLSARKDRLAEVVSAGDVIKTVEPREGGFQTFFDELVQRGEEGIMIKRRESPYYPGTRSRHWQKVKSVVERVALAVGYTEGDGKRAESFGALVLSDGEQFIGRVGSGFDEAELEALQERFVPVDERPFPESTVGRPYTPIEPFVVQVQYQEVTDNEDLRAPVFVRVRQDKPIADVTPLSESP